MLLVAFGLIAVVAVCICGEIRWESGTRALRDRIEGARDPTESAVFDGGELENLPAPVQAYFRTVLQDAQPIVAAVSIEHTGTFNMGEASDRWKPFASTQRVVTRRAGFVWDGCVTMMPGLRVRVHDAYVAGEGLLHAAVLGIVSVANMRGVGDLAQGELMRFLAEAVWYPTALLPSQGVHWSAVNDRSAAATLEDGDHRLTLLFHFNEDGLIDVVSAETRGRTVDGTVVPTPWQGRFWNYAIRDGMRVPLEGEVAWLLPEGAKPYWRGRVTELSYEFAP